MIDVAGGDKVPRKGGPGITQSDLLVINKTGLAPLVGADLSVMESDEYDRPAAAHADVARRAGVPPAEIGPLARSLVVATAL